MEEDRARGVCTRKAQVLCRSASESCGDTGEIRKACLQKWLALAAGPHDTEEKPVHRSCWRREAHVQRHSAEALRGPCWPGQRGSTMGRQAGQWGGLGPRRPSVGFSAPASAGEQGQVFLKQGVRFSGFLLERQQRQLGSCEQVGVIRVRNGEC